MQLHCNWPLQLRACNHSLQSCCVLQECWPHCRQDSKRVVEKGITLGVVDGKKLDGKQATAILTALATSMQTCLEKQAIFKVHCGKPAAGSRRQRT